MLAGIGEETSLGLGQGRVEPGHHENGIGLGQEACRGRGVDFDGRPDPGGVGELEPEPQDLGGNLHLNRGHLQFGTRGAHLRHEPGHVRQGRLNGKGGSRGGGPWPGSCCHTGPW
jgi:hypothetical protein